MRLSVTIFGPCVTVMSHVFNSQAIYVLKDCGILHEQGHAVFHCPSVHEECFLQGYTYEFLGKLHNPAVKDSL